MDYKAKYEDALKRADAAINIAADKDLVKGVATTIFPELRESEDENNIDDLNLLKEIQNYYEKYLAGLYITFLMYRRIARYFYFLGKKQK